MSFAERLMSFLVVGLFLCSCASILPGRGVSDEARIDAARAEMASVKQGLFVYQAESSTASFPTSQMISNYADLARILSPYLMQFH